MKKLLILTVVAAVAFGACKKNQGTVSTLHNYSTPTLVVSSGDYYSIPVGGALPVITATAYDSFYNEEATVVYDQSELDNTTEGVYPVVASARNQYGMTSKHTLYVAVTNVTGVDLSGTYYRTETSDTVNVSTLANGLYRISDAVANGASDTMHRTPAYFVHTSTDKLLMPVQSTSYGPVSASEGMVSISTSTTISYILHNNMLAPVTRTFHKM
jgi:hypothetical protein